VSRAVLRIFVSSPGDVGEERVMTARVIQQLQGLQASWTRCGGPTMRTMKRDVEEAVLPRKVGWQLSGTTLGMTDQDLLIAAKQLLADCVRVVNRLKHPEPATDEDRDEFVKLALNVGSDLRRYGGEDVAGAIFQDAADAENPHTSAFLWLIKPPTWFDETRAACF